MKAPSTLPKCSHNQLQNIHNHKHNVIIILHNVTKNSHILKKTYRAKKIYMNQIKILHHLYMHKNRIKLTDEKRIFISPKKLKKIKSSNQ